MPHLLPRMVGRIFYYLKLRNLQPTAMFQTNPLGVELLSYLNTFFCSNKFAWIHGHVSKNAQFFRLRVKWYDSGINIYRTYKMNG